MRRLNSDKVQEARSLQIKARLAGKELSVQHGYGGELWCYKHELEIIKI